MQLKYVFLIIIFLIFGNQQDEEVIEWNESRALTWADFKGEPILNTSAVALTASGITFGYSVKTSNGKIVDFSTTVESHFYPNKSWYIKSKSNDYILKHEQLHFDITELYTRKFRKEIQQLKVNQNIRQQLNDLHYAINQELRNTQKRYDEESEHSIVKSEQQRWNMYIAEELKKLDSYKSQ